MKVKPSKFILALGIVFFSLSSYANSVCTTPELSTVSATDSTEVNPLPPIPIVVRQVPSNDDQRSIIPIDITYDDKELEFEFYANLGTVYVVVTNNTTYERWSDYIDTSLGNISFDLYTQNPYGYYNVMIYTDNNGNFGGDFIVQ